MKVGTDKVPLDFFQLSSVRMFWAGTVKVPLGLELGHGQWDIWQRASLGSGWGLRVGTDKVPLGVLGLFEGYGQEWPQVRCRIWVLVDV